MSRLSDCHEPCTSVFCHEHILLNLYPYIFEQSMEDRAHTCFTISVVFSVVVRPVVWQAVVSTNATSTDNKGFTVGADKDHYDLELPLKQIFESNSVFFLLLVIEVWVKRTLKTNSVYLHLNSRGLWDSIHNNKYLYKYISAKRKALGIIILYIFLVSNVYSITTASVEWSQAKLYIKVRQTSRIKDLS